MGPFHRLYVWTLRLAAHRHAPVYLGVLSFAESSFFPIPPDVMLAPMALARPKRALWFALLTTVTSVLGGLFGYLVGAYGFELVQPWLERTGHMDEYQLARQWFEQWGFWVVLIAGFSPIPYKVFTITAGVVGLGMLPFLLASVVGRGARFFLVALLLGWGGPKIEPWLRSYVDRIGWATVALLVAGMAVVAMR